MLNKKIMDEIMKKYEELNNDDDFWFDYVGVRVQEQEFVMGDIDHNSVVWVDGSETKEELDGICAVSIKAVKRVGLPYYGKHIAILASNSAHSGEDDGEIVMQSAEVVAIIK